MNTGIKNVGKINNQKGGYRGNKMWSAHRLEGDVKKFAIKPIKKPKKIIKKPEDTLNKKITHFL